MKELLRIKSLPTLILINKIYIEKGKKVTKRNICEKLKFSKSQVDVHIKQLVELNLIKSEESIQNSICKKLYYPISTETTINFNFWNLLNNYIIKASSI